MAAAFTVRYGPRVRASVVSRGGHPLPDAESFRAGADALRMADAVGLTGVAFVPTEILLLLVVGGMALGCIGGFVVARTVR